MAKGNKWIIVTKKLIIKKIKRRLLKEINKV